MACTNPAQIRNIGIIAHIDAGKTTLSERILFYSRKIHRLGEVHDGAATMDFMPEEQERGITIASACTTCRWRDCQINLIDTPGHVDFTMEVERSLRVLDSAIGVFCAVGGVEPQSETVWRQARKFNVPRLAFINKIDRPGADYARVITEINERLGDRAVAFTVPLPGEENTSSLIDLLSWQVLSFAPDELGAVVRTRPLDSREAEAATPLREKMLECIAEADDGFLSLWYGGDYTVADVQSAVRRAVAKCELTPVFCGAALRNSGVQPLLDAVCLYLPSPAEIVTRAWHDGKSQDLHADPKAEPVALVFKLQFDANRKNCFLRVYSGRLKECDTLYNPRTQKQERVNRIYRLHASQRDQIDEICAGDIALVGGLQCSVTGDTWCLKKHPLLLEAVQSYEPVVTLALEPANTEEGKVLDEVLARYQAEDPTLKYELDEKEGTRTISGMGELHLEVVLERLKREFRLSPRSGQPRASLRETIGKEARARFVFDRELGKERHQGEVELQVVPLERGAGSKIATGDFLPTDPAEARRQLPAPYLDAIREGILDGLQNGPIAGWPLVDIEVRIEDAVRTESLSTTQGMRLAASMALRDALAKASPALLEPIMEVVLSTPGEYMGAVIGLFTQCGGKVEKIEDSAGVQKITGCAPLQKLFGFPTSLRSVSQGKAGISTSFRSFGGTTAKSE